MYQRVGISLSSSWNLCCCTWDMAPPALATTGLSETSDRVTSRALPRAAVALVAHLWLDRSRHVEDDGVVTQRRPGDGADRA
ncbi:hypothetical protein GCM10009844_29610 [Nocardioides koreensis]|uniref:Uncharacterized protein n=1 Tax=Nocardioides koreensis TaxID=433651 RepID=A0ABN2ZXL4_9ACTN